MVSRVKKSVSEILDGIERRVKHLKKLKAVRDERKKLNDFNEEVLNDRIHD